MTVVAKMTAVVPNRNMVVPTVNDLKVCMDMPASRRPRNIRVTSAAIATDSRWAAAMNIAGTEVNIAVANIAAVAVNITVVRNAVVARDTGAAAGKTNTTNAAVTAIPPAARALSAATTSQGAITRNNNTTIRAAIARAKVTAADATMTTTAIATTAAARDTATKTAAGGIERRTQSPRGLVMKTPNAGAAWTNSAHIAADGDRKIIAVPTSASKKTSTIA